MPDVYIPNLAALYAAFMEQCEKVIIADTTPDDIREHRENIDQAHAEEVRDAWMKAATQPREWPWPDADEDVADIKPVPWHELGPYYKQPDKC